MTAAGARPRPSGGLAPIMGPMTLLQAPDLAAAGTVREADADQEAAARAWIAGLRPFAFFQRSAVPGAAAPARRAIRGLLAADKPTIGELVDDGNWEIYWRQPAPAHPRYRDTTVAFEARELFRQIMPPGSGVGSLEAINLLRWSTQMPIRNHVAAIDPAFKPPSLGYETPVVHLRANQRRAALTWHEVSILEAMSVWYMKTRPAKWRTVTRGMRRWGTLERLGSDPVVDRDKLLWAAETESHLWNLDPDTRDDALRHLRRLPRRLR